MNKKVKEVLDDLKENGWQGRKGSELRFISNQTLWDKLKQEYGDQKVGKDLVWSCIYDKDGNVYWFFIYETYTFDGQTLEAKS